MLTPTLSMGQLLDAHRQAARLIVNPRAGGGAASRLAPRALRELTNVGWNVDAVHTDRPGAARRLARAAVDAGKRCLIAVGGDGTGSEVLSGLMDATASHAEDVVLACLPGGRGNSFLRDFGIHSADDGMARLLASQTRPLDVGRYRCRVAPLSEEWTEACSLNLLGVGFVADVCAAANGPLRFLGEGAYSVGVVTMLARLRSPETAITIDGQIHRLPSCLTVVANSQYTGGRMWIAPHADVSDGLLDVLVATDLGRLELIQLFPRIFSGTHLGHKKLRQFLGRTIRIEPSLPARVLADGELPGWTPLEVELLPAAVTLLA